MKVIAGILTGVDLVAGLAAGELFSHRERALWLGVFLIVIVVGYAWAAQNHPSLPPERQEKWRYMGYVPGITSSMSAGHTKLFCILLGSWLVCLVVRVAVHYV